MVFNLSLTFSKSLRLSRTLLSILDNLNISLVWMVLILPLISSSSSLRSKLLGPFQLQLVSPSTSCSIFFYSRARSKYFFAQVRQNVKIYKFVFFYSFFYFLIISRSGRLAEIKWSVCIWKSQKILCLSFCEFCFGHIPFGCMIKF